MSTTSSRPAVQSPIAALRQYGPAVWLDFIRRSLITGGELKRLVDEDGLGGVTSNPAIFEKAIDGSNDYATAIEEISKDPHLGPKAVYERLAVKDIQDASARCTNRPGAAMATSAWKCLRTWPTIQTGRCRKHVSCGRRLPGPTH
jgi:hypothetical protein